MKKIIYICNRCGKEIQKDAACISMQILDVGTGKREEIALSDEDIHFCMGCAKEAMQKFLRLPEAGDEGRPEKVPDLKEKHTRLDTGKVMALYRAGWDDKKIADEMGATERQIYQCIRDQKKKAAPDNGVGGKEQA